MDEFIISGNTVVAFTYYHAEWENMNLQINLVFSG